MWIGPSMSMIQSMFPAEYVGTAIAAFWLFGGFSGAISTFLLGVLGDHFKTDEHPRTAGNLITI